MVASSVELIGLFQKDLRNKRVEHLDSFIKTFGNVGLTDLTSNPLIDGMKKIYELEPFINPIVIEGKITISFAFIPPSTK